MGKAVTIWDNSTEGLGPHMRALNQRQRQFVYAILETGRNDHTAAARMAGYGLDSDNALRVQAHRLAHNPRIQAAMHEEAEKRLGGAKIMAVSELVRLAESTTNEGIKLRAIAMLLNRTGLHEKTEHKVTVDHADSGADMMARIKFLADALGVDATKLAGTATPKQQLEAIDVESEAVEEVSLEDIL